MKPLCILRTSLHWLLTQWGCQYRVDLKRGVEEKILHPTFGKVHSSRLKEEPESAISLPNYTDFSYMDSPISMSWSKAEIIGHGSTLQLNSVILGKTRGKVIATGKLATTEIIPREKKSLNLEHCLLSSPWYHNQYLWNLTPRNILSHLTPYHNSSQHEAPNGSRLISNLK